MMANLSAYRKRDSAEQERKLTYQSENLLLLGCIYTQDSE
jgi:hypothetical protein